MKYKYIIGYDLDNSELASFGLEGWELVCVTSTVGAFGKTYQTFYFKKTLQAK